jgi:dolichyl-phosphate-mannose-protein mannosyltransferase
LYPEGVGARQQQITAYTHKDDNNKWVLHPFPEENVSDGVLLISKLFFSSLGANEIDSR